MQIPTEYVTPSRVILTTFLRSTRPELDQLFFGRPRRQSLPVLLIINLLPGNIRIGHCVLLFTEEIVGLEEGGHKRDKGQYKSRDPEPPYSILVWDQRGFTVMPF